MIRSTRSYLNDSLASLPPSQVPSGRQSPQTGYGIPGSASSPGIAKAASETGGMGTTQALLRRAAAAVTSSGNSRQQEEDKMLDRFRELLMHGMPTKALEHACRSHLWGHAFVLAQRLGPALFQKVMDRFLTRAIPVSDPILTLYQLTAGELPQSVNAAAYGRGSDNGEWRPHLAMILASECAQPELIQTALERLGDNLLSRRLVYAAHLCYLLIGPLIKQDLIKCDQHQQQQHHYQQQQQPVYRLPDKIWLLGVTSSSNSTTGTDVSGPNAYGEGCAQNLHPLNASTEAIQLTEVYEYAMRLANQNYRLPQLLPFKLVYVTRLIDAGLLDKAYRYLTAIGQDLLLEAKRYEAHANGPQSVSPTLYSMVGNCLRLIEPLQNHPELDGFELAAPSRVPMSLAGSLNAASFLPQLRELYDRMNRQLARAQYASVICTPPKLSTDMIGSGETHTASEPVVQHQSPPDPRNLNTPVYADLRQHHQSLAQPSTPSSVIETSSTGPPVTAYAVPGRHSTTSQSYASGRSEPAAQSYGLSEPSGCRPQGELINTQPGMHTAPDRPDASARMSSSSAYGPSSQTAEPSGFNKPQSVPFDQRISFEQPSRPTGSNFDPNFGVVDSTGGVPNGPVHCSNLFGVFSPPGSQRDRDGLTLDGTNVPTGQMPMTATVPEQLQPNSSLFFTPIVSSYTESSGPDGPQVGTPGVFDYFAGLRSTEQQPGNRSRTVSGGSQSSTIGGYPHTRSRNSSGMGPSRRSSANYDRSVHMASQSHPGPPQTPKHMSPSHDLQQHPIKEESSHAHLSHQTPVRVSKEEKPDDEQGDAPGNAAQSKDGWFSGLFGRLKRNGAKSVHLPDDSKPSIVWDDERKEWVDVNNPDAGQTPPPPPPMMMPTQNTTPGPIPGASISPGGGGASSPPIGRGGSRSRYVNVLANQTAGPAAAKLDAPLPPPLPATASYGASPIMPPTTTAPLRHSLQSSEYNLRPAPVPQTKDVNNSSHFQMDGSTSGLMMYH
ncbi:Protein transport protein Sec16A [Fasciola hepatica]|uniref:Protein transport protein Sec16A n=1 Tax=Fasciola hepatica TaxID=6192 RepID=A0A4E0RTS4_FASHE|nr:Protein transport protein Sec16A [Fasciola hepatica]